MKECEYILEVRFFKKSERQLLLDSIDRLWKHDHIYVRKPEVLEHLVLNTPYRAEFAGEDNYSFMGMWDDEGNVVGLSGTMPQRINVFGEEYQSNTGTVWIVDKTCGKPINGLDFFYPVFDKGVKAIVSLGQSKYTHKVYSTFGAYMFKNFPRWVGITRIDDVVNNLIPASTNHFILPQITTKSFSNISKHKIEYNNINPKKWDDYYYKTFAPITIGTQRDYRFLKWRYMDSPILHYDFITIEDNDGNYLGLAVVRHESILNGKFFLGRILEFISLDSVGSIELAQAVINIYPDPIAWDFYCLSDITAFGLEAIGFRKIPSWINEVMMPTRFQPVDYENLQINGSVYLDKDIHWKVDQFANPSWYITRGDGDQDRAN